MKKYFTFLSILLMSCLFSCSEYKYVPPTPDEVENFQKVDGIHTIADEDVSSYVVIRNQPHKGKNKQELLYSITLFMNFEKGNRIKRFYNYYQFDYYLDDDTFGYDYHIFDSIDGAYRNYGQNFMPFYNLQANMKEFRFLVKYSFCIKNSETGEEESYNKQCSYKETIIDFDYSEIDDYIDYTNEYFDIEFLDLSVDNEDFNRYKFNINPKMDDGHIDSQLFIELEDGVIIPFVGIYHYNVNNNMYYSVSDEILSKEYNIKNIYLKSIYFDLDGNNTKYLYRIKIDNK